jgi:lipopolysaccharide export system ATP-binding protein
MTSSAVLSTTDLKKSFRHVRAVENVGLEIKSGEVVGLLGPNGAGKTTSFRMIVGLLRPDKGCIRLDGDDITKLPMYQRARRGIAYLPQEPSIFQRMTVEENLRAIAETKPLTKKEQTVRVEKLMDDLGISHLANSRGYALSGGERRRTEIARALVAEPRFFLLDEPFAGIDPIAIEDLQGIVASLKERNIGVLITDHNVRETLRITDHAYIINEGVVIRAGTPEEIASDARVREVYLGGRFELDVD